MTYIFQSTSHTWEIFSFVEPLWWPEVDLLLMLPCTALAPLKVSTELTRLYTGLYSVLMDFTRLNNSFWITWGSNCDASGLVLIINPLHPSVMYPKKILSDRKVAFNYHSSRTSGLVYSRFSGFEYFPVNVCYCLSFIYIFITIEAFSCIGKESDG